MTDKRKKLPDDLLLEQIVEDDNGNMHVVPAEWLAQGGPRGENPLTENDLGNENAENDLPCADVQAYDSLEEDRDKWPDEKQRAAIRYSQWDDWQELNGHPEKAEK